MHGENLKLHCSWFRNNEITKIVLWKTVNLYTQLVQGI